MNRISLSCLAIGTSLLLTAGCGGSTEAGSGGAANTGGAGGGGAETLAGTWEVSGTRYGADQTTGLISLASQQFSIHTEGGSVSAIAKADGSIEVVVTDDTYRGPWDPPAATGTLLASRTAPGVFGVPSFPLDLSGAWAVYDSVDPSPKHACTSTLQGDTIQAACKSARRFRWMPDFANGALSCNRSSTLASMFGAFGGEWQCTTSPAKAACVFRFEGATISSNCSNAPGLNGTMTVTFEGDVASGQTSTGFEFSAIRN